ncbi:hypothetical protein P7F88_25420 [Vibrio hannami]|uniref:hypothetical protein n=1 Tax=Vibrio hannami TaxID=2717094 RepID=UPI00240EE5FC|nr:hypothetical protein [Vibrio hannami]MDG3089206.1 hypothetical protein [Vibrio hannami]
MTDLHKRAADLLAKCEGMTEGPNAYLIVKQGLYYRPESKGYTGLKAEAGRYTLDEVSVWLPNLDSPNQDGISFILADDAPEASAACYRETLDAHKAAHLTEALALIRDLTADRDAAIQAAVEKEREACKAIVKERPPEQAFAVTGDR